MDWPLRAGAALPWDLLPPASLASIDLDATAWSTLLILLRDTSGVRSMIMRISNMDDVSSILGHDRGHPFPAVTEFTLRGEQPGLSLHVASIKALCAKLSLSSKLTRLRVLRLDLLGDAQELKDISDEVAYY
ncbi:hypothetical protein AURDEDRAFT_165841 [Auricularia subglabra TFB-10046 SS5]|nr:hypothetical protein AURDEDRAFT_165841 [Auricularia subglabra TFB-10046 SS5]